MGMMGREVVAASQREQGLGYILHRELFWIELPIKQELLHSLSCYQCMFLSKMLSRTHHTDLCMQRNGGDQVCLFLLWKSHEDTSVPPVSGILRVISLVSDF